ncbi:MAG: FAD-dependent oxidoreductase [Deltaproteobacteria bacterium]|nr:FAD-dependent oxidoreductase [Deltaproteobacteria bacterium]
MNSESNAPGPRAGTVILGAGLTGLSCAVHLDDAPYRLIERSDGVGGLARTHRRPHGFLCDGTGHWLHLRQDWTKALVRRLLGDSLTARARRARVFSQGVYTEYPFQANTYGLPKEVIEACLTGFIKARYEEQRPEPTNYAEWVRKEFGEGISTHFMFPYNRKIYGVPLETLAADFAAKYIPRPSLEDVVRGAIGRSREALGYNATFVYPTHGGIGALSEALHANAKRRAEFHRTPQRIDLSTRSLRLDGGEEVPFGDLVSTIPLPTLVELLVAGCPTSVPSMVVDAARRLRANTVLYFDIALKGAPKANQDHHWIYVPEPEFPFYRVGSYSAVEPSLAPPGHRSYYVEIGHENDHIEPSRLEQPVLDGLKKLGIVERDEDVLFMIPNVLSPAYVLFDDAYADARRTILDWLETERVISVGRYGRWQYNAMEDALLEGREAAERILARTRSPSA